MCIWSMWNHTRPAYSYQHHPIATHLQSYPCLVSYTFNAITIFSSDKFLFTSYIIYHLYLCIICSCTRSGPTQGPAKIMGAWPPVAPRNTTAREVGFARICPQCSTSKGVRSDSQWFDCRVASTKTYRQRQESSWPTSAVHVAPVFDPTSTSLPPQLLLLATLEHWLTPTQVD